MEIQIDKRTLQQELHELQTARMRCRIAGRLAIVLIPVGIIFGIVGFFVGIFAGSEQYEQIGEAFLFCYVGFFMFVLGIVSIVLSGIFSYKLAKLEQKFESTDVYSQAPMPELIEALRDWDPIVRKKAAHALGEVGPDAKDAVQALIEILENDDEYLDVSCSAAWALGEIGDKAAITALRDTMNNDGVEDDIRTKATEALKKIEGKT